VIEFVGIGDLHLDKLDKILPDANRLIVAEVRKAFKYAVKNGIRLVVFYGDLGDKARMSYEAQLALLQLILDPKYIGLEKHFILGNHDFDEHGRHSLEWILPWLDSGLLSDEFNVRVHSQPKYHKEGKSKLLFLPYPHKETDASALNIGHFETRGSMRDNGLTIKTGFRLKHLACLGHLHTPHVVGKAHYSGTLYQLNFGESLPKGFHHVKYEDARRFKIAAVANDPAFKMFNLEVFRRTDLKQISSNPLHLYKLFVQDAVDVDPELLSKYPNAIKVKFFHTKDELTQLIDEEWKENESIEGLFQPEEDLEAILAARQPPDHVKARALELHRNLLGKLK
jgi:DNA repair exonuclease SbcCD nuclease subunit